MLEKLTPQITTVRLIALISHTPASLYALVVASIYLTEQPCIAKNSQILHKTSKQLTRLLFPNKKVARLVPVIRNRKAKRICQSQLLELVPHITKP